MSEWNACEWGKSRGCHVLTGRNRFVLQTNRWFLCFIAGRPYLATRCKSLSKDMIFVLVYRFAQLSLPWPLWPWLSLRPALGTGTADTMDTLTATTARGPLMLKPALRPAPRPALGTDTTDTLTDTMDTPMDTDTGGRTLCGICKDFEMYYSYPFCKVLISIYPNPIVK